MKKIILLFSLLAFIAIESQAQVSRTNIAAGIGIRGGLNFFTFGGSDAPSNNLHRTGIHFGGFTNLFLGQKVAIEPGIYYSTKGTKHDDLTNSRAVLGYVDIPLLLRLYIAGGINVFGGPQASFLTSSRFEGDLFGTTFSYDTESITKTDLGFVVGLGYNLAKGFNFQGSYDIGTSPVFKDGDAQIYNRGFKLSLGYAF